VSSYTLGLTSIAAAGAGPIFACPGAGAVQVTVFNAAVTVQLGDGIGGVLWRDVPSFRVPGVHVIPGPADAVRVAPVVWPPADPAKPPRYSIDAF
jgi:hypothetical protein